MTDQEALKLWLWIAWRKGQQTERLAKRVENGMPVAEAVAEHEAPLKVSPTKWGYLLSLNDPVGR